MLRGCFEAVVLEVPLSISPGVVVLRIALHYISEEIIFIFIRFAQCFDHESAVVPILIAFFIIRAYFIKPS